MIKQKTIESFRRYLEKMPDIDTALVLEAISILTLQHEVDCQSIAKV